MTLETIFDRLTAIDRQIQALLGDIGMDNDRELWDTIAPSRTDPDEMFRYNELCGILVPFCRLHQKLAYLQLPCTETHVLRRFPNGRYGYDEQPFTQGHTFSCGCPVEALIPDEDGNPCWVSTRIEHNGTDYYLYGYGSIPLNGLTVRERRHTA